MSTESGTGFETERMNIGREAPALARALVALEREIRIDPVLRELVKLRASILNGCAYCIDMHTKDARKDGESEQRLYAVAAWHEAPFFSERERAVRPRRRPRRSAHRPTAPLAPRRWRKRQSASSHRQGRRRVQRLAQAND